MTKKERTILKNFSDSKNNIISESVDLFYQFECCGTIGCGECNYRKECTYISCGNDFKSSCGTGDSYECY